MKDTIEAREDCFTGVAEIDELYNICEIHWWESDNEGEEREVRVWDVPLDLKQKIRTKLIKEACRMEENSRKPDPMDLSHERKENL